MHFRGLQIFFSLFEESVQWYIVYFNVFMPCPILRSIFHKMFYAGPNILSQPKKLTAFSASSKTFVLAQKTIYGMQIIFLSATKKL